jgi:hypothetical protein
MDFITNTHGKTVPHDGGRGFCGAHGSCACVRVMFITVSFPMSIVTASSPLEGPAQVISGSGRAFC